jgi:hypothetical protein
MINYDPNKGRRPLLGGISARYLGGDPLGLLDQGDTEVDQATTLTGGQSDILAQLTKLLGGEIGSSGPVFQGQRVAGESPLQQQAFGLASGLGGLASQAFGFGTELPQALGQAQDQLTRTLQPFDPQSTISNFAPARDVAIRQFEDVTIPNILERFAGANAVRSSAAPQAIADAGSELSQGLSAQLGQLLQQGEQSQLNRQQAGINQALQVAGAPTALTQQAGQTGLGLLQGLFGLGQQQRGITQQGLSGQQQKFQEGLASANPFLNLLPTALGTSSFENIVTPGAPSILEQIGPLVGAAAAACDIRLKDDIKEIPDCLDKVSKLEAYEYNFKPVGDRRAGIMAQDLEKVLPTGVVEVDGVKMVKIESVMALLVGAINELSSKIREN